jgi:hypothetical protein
VPAFAAKGSRARDRGENVGRIDSETRASSNRRMRLRFAVVSCGLLFAAGACSGDDFSAVPGGTSGSAGDSTPTAGAGGDAGDAGQAGAAQAGAGQDAGSGGDVSAGAAGAGAGGSAGSGGQDPAGSGGGGGDGPAGGAGAGGTLSCDLAIPTAPPSQAVCGNGVVEAGEDCDDAKTTGTDGCVDCKMLCPVSGVSVPDGQCYFLSGATATFAPKDVYDAPPGPDDGSGGYIRAKWGVEWCSTRGLGTHLAQFESADEWKTARIAFQVVAGVKPALPAIVWIASAAKWATTLDVSDRSFWFDSDGGNTADELWKPGFPAAPAAGTMPGALCGTLGMDGYLINTPCFGTPDASAKHQSLCEREPVCALVDSQPSPVPPQIGYRGANGHCYARITTKVFSPSKWDAADAVCKRFGAHLARFEDPGEIDALRGAGLTQGEVWIGAERKVCANNEFVWSGTNLPVPPPTTAAGARLWGGVEPNNGNEKCAAMDERRKLADLPCEYNKGALCERDF